MPYIEWLQLGRTFIGILAGFSFMPYIEWLQQDLRFDVQLFQCFMPYIEWLQH